MSEYLRLARREGVCVCVCVCVCVRACVFCISFILYILDRKARY